MSNKRKEIGAVLRFGAATAAMYVALFSYEHEVLRMTGQGGWTFLIPIAVAFALSYAHGNFTAAFWDFVGIKAKK